MRISKLLLGLTLSIASHGVLAEVVPIYSAAAPVMSDSARDREQGLRNALRRVLVKVSGDPSVANAPELDARLGEAISLVRAESMQQRQSVNALGQPEVRLMLSADFDPEGVNRIVTSLGRPVWREDRPGVLVWLVVDDGTRKQIASSAQVDALSALTQRAIERGLPVHLPRMDAVDAGRVDAVTLWDAPPKTVAGASGRYGTPVSLLIRLKRSGPQWSARYHLINGNEFEEWSGVDASSQPLLAQAIDGATDRLARRLAFDRSEPAIGAVQWWLDNLQSAEDFARAIGYLQKQEAIREVQVLAAEGDRALVGMLVQAGPRRLKQLLAFDRRLSLLEIPANEPDQAPTYSLEYVP